MTELVVATTNPGKLRELEALIPPGFTLLSLADVGLAPIEEIGETFAANAIDKAVNAAKGSGRLAFADDSGLEVDALDGQPGVRSARFAGEPADDARNIEKLLGLLRHVPEEQRGARFRCVVSLAWPDGRVVTAEGACDGSIGQAPRGTNGFGYDPIFVRDDGRTMAELPDHEKNQISHRAAALEALRGDLRLIAGSAEGPA